jgi:hypothetical protein
MKNYNLISIFTVLLASSVLWTSTSFAAVNPQSVINVEGLTLDEAKKKYGVESGSNHPVIFEVNAESGSKKCELIVASGNSHACPTGKIFYQSSQLRPNHDGTSTMRVDILYDVNEMMVISSNKMTR